MNTVVIVMVSGVLVGLTAYGCKWLCDRHTALNVFSTYFTQMEVELQKIKDSDEYHNSDLSALCWSLNKEVQQSKYSNGVKKRIDDLFDAYYLLNKK